MSNEQTLKSLGYLIDADKLPNRDAVHVAVVPCQAGEPLAPGFPVMIEPDKRATGCSISSTAYVGVVDPFLSYAVETNQWFWLYLKPGSITSLTHHWTHPAFPVEEKAAISEKAPKSEKLAAENWIQDYAESLGIAYRTLMDGADLWVSTEATSKWGGEYLILGGILEGHDTSDTFWEKYEIVRGVTLRSEAKTNFFSCSC